MPTLTEQITALNQADLSGLRSRIDALRTQAAAEMKWTSGEIDDKAAEALARKLKPKLDEITRRST